MAKRSASAQVRVFYPNKALRDRAFESLVDIAASMCAEAEEAKKIVRETDEREVGLIRREIQTSRRHLQSGRSSHFHPAANFSRRNFANVVDYAAYHEALKVVDRCEVADGSAGLVRIDAYASSQGVYGIEMPEKVLWQGYVTPQDISREEGSEYDTGQ